MTPTTQWENGAHTASLVSVAGEDVQVPAAVQVVTAPHARSDVTVGATVWYVRPSSHCVAAGQTVFEVAVAAAVSYVLPAGQGVTALSQSLSEVSVAAADS